MKSGGTDGLSPRPGVFDVRYTHPEISGRSKPAHISGILRRSKRSAVHVLRFSSLFWSWSTASLVRGFLLGILVRPRNDWSSFSCVFAVLDLDCSRFIKPLLNQ